MDASSGSYYVCRVETADGGFNDQGDRLYKEFCKRRYAIVQFEAQSSEQAALDAAYGQVHGAAGLFSTPLEDRLHITHTTGECGFKDCGFKQVFAYCSGPWPPEALSRDQHSVLQKASSTCC
jgi:hypothetical protein